MKDIGNTSVVGLYGCYKLTADLVT